MTTNLIPSIETLPVEIFHRIFDNLDAETIIFSIRPLSRLFRSITTTYDRYILNFHLISKSNFYILCRLIKPENVTSLTLSNDDRTSDQINLFISLVRLKQFTRLRFLNLFDINESQLNFILKRINLNLLISFSFNIKQYDNRRKETTTNLLSSIISKVNLHRLEFDLKSERISKILWPINRSIHHLIINNGMTMNNLLRILQCSICLCKLTIKQHFDSIMNDDISKSSCLTPFQQLTFLSIENVNVNIDKLERFLLLTPSLIYLKLIGGVQMLDGKRWEDFIQINLCYLEKFEFYFREWKPIKQTLIDLQLIISSFQTIFWIEHKKWFITCEYNNNYSYAIHLYSLPICQSVLHYTPNSEKTSLTTNPMRLDNDSTIMDNINSINLTLSKVIADDIQKTITNHPIFPKVTKIDIILEKEYPLLSLHSLSTFINICQIVQIKLYAYHFNTYNQNILMDISSFFKQAHNLSSLFIHSGFYRYKLDLTIENIYSIIPNHIKHLKIPINTINQINIILERCKYLSTIQLDLRFSKKSEEFIQWFNDNTNNSTCFKRYRTISIWLGRKQIQSIENNINYKRIRIN